MIEIFIIELPEYLGSPECIQPYRVHGLSLAVARVDLKMKEAASEKARHLYHATQIALAAAPKEVSFADLGGIDSILKDILELVQWPLLHPKSHRSTKQKHPFV